MKHEFIAGYVLGAAMFGTVGVFAGQYVATENPYSIQLNGNNVSIEGYNIDGSTYFKLREIADVVGGFDVDFNDDTIILTSPSSKNQYYTALGSISTIAQNAYEVYNAALGDYVSYLDGTLAGDIQDYFDIDTQKYSEYRTEVQKIASTIEETDRLEDYNNMIKLLDKLSALLDYYEENTTFDAFNALYERNNEDDDAVPFNKFYEIKNEAEKLQINYQ